MNPIFFVWVHQVVQEISRIYNSIDDVDLFIGGVSERIVDGALLGPTFLCLIGDQFARLRRGDRLFYEEATAKFTQRKLHNTIDQQFIFSPHPV
jgi:peroxidase